MTNNSLAQLPISAEASCPQKDGSLILSGSSVSISLPAAPKRYLYHGWQSWSLTTWIETARRMPTVRPAILHPMQLDPLYVHDKRPNGAWYGAVELEDGQIILLGALGLDAHVALDGTVLKGWYDDIEQTNEAPHEWFVASGDEPQVMAHYAELLGDRLGKGRTQKPYRVWCSWYSLYTEIYETQLLKILKDLDDLPFDVFQVDDGWQQGIGNWEANEKFSSGMASLASRIKETGRIAGLWLAPLLVVPSSNIYQEHRDWLLHDEKGRLVSAGFNWSEKLFALDTTHPEALEWLAQLMKKVHGWGYDYAKLDFLYAGALPGKRYVEMSREAAYRYGLKVIRDALGEAYFLTCGAPIFPSLGLCDGMRVGPDVAEYWTSHRDDDLLMNFTIPGARNALRTTLNRLWLQPLVHTDPDVAYFRSKQNALTPEQKSNLQDLAQIADFKATSDVPAWLSETERETLKEYLESKPRIQRMGKYVFQIGDRTIDFASLVQLPPPAGPFSNAWGALIGGLASIPWLMRIVDKMSRASAKKRIEADPA